MSLSSCSLTSAPLPPISLFFFNDTATTEIYTLSLHDALPICAARRAGRSQRLRGRAGGDRGQVRGLHRSEEHTSELQSHLNLVCRLLLEKKKQNDKRSYTTGDRERATRQSDS